MSDVIFWRNLQPGQDAVDVILGATFEQAREVLRAVEYRQTIENAGWLPNVVDAARDSIKDDAQLLGRVKNALSVIHTSRSEDSITIAGLHLRHAFLTLGENPARQAQTCPIIPVAIQIAGDLRAIMK